VLEQSAEANASYIQSQKRRWIRVVPVRKECFAIACIGDPHLDNKGANLARLKADLDLLAATGIRAINMGDLVDNFAHAGRLAKVQANNRVSIKEALAMARWFIRDSGVRFDAHLIGNHDAWAGLEYQTMLNQWCAEAQSRVYDWIVRLVYQWEDGSFSILAAHDFKGHSIHNPLHGLMRRATEDGQDDVYVAGHRHNSAEGGFENGFRGKTYRFIRVKGYKDWDGHAHRNGFPQQESGASCLLVVDPFASDVNRVRTYMDLAEGVEALNYLKSRYADG